MPKYASIKISHCSFIARLIGEGDGVLWWRLSHKRPHGFYRPLVGLRPDCNKRCFKLRYIITSEQLIIQHGVLTRTSDYIELYRVVDFSENRDILEQLFGLKTVWIFSGDRSNPKLDIYGVKERLDVVRIIRERVEYNKKRKGIYEITNR